MHLVKLRDVPSFMDIPGRLRWLADRIESGEFDVRTAVVVIESDASIRTLSYGENPTTNEIVGLLTRAARMHG